MATDSGFASQKKDGGTGQHVTVGPVREQQHGYDVRAHSFVQSVATDAAETGSTTTSIVATSHVAIVGDIISFTSGNLAKKEYAVRSVSANAIVPVETMSEAPANGDTFKILRFKHPVVDSDGLISITAASGPIAFNLDGSQEEVTEDTGTPANNIPLPVKLVNAAGDIIGQEAMAASIPVVIASDQSDINVGDITGTVSLPTGAATEAKQDDAIALLTTIDGDTSAMVTDLDTIAGDTTSIDANTAAIAADTDVIAGDTTSIDGKLVQLALDEGDASGALRTVEAKTNISYTAKGKIAGGDLTGSYATLLNPASDMRIIYLLNSCNNTILVSLDGGTTDSLELEAGESVSIDLASNGLKFSAAVNISAKHAGAAPTAGTIRASGIG